MIRRSDWLQRVAVYIDRVHLPDTLMAATAFLAILYLLGHLIAWAIR